MSLQATGQTFGGQVFTNPAVMGVACVRNWYAVYTTPQHEKSVLKHLDLREIESFLPVYETVRVWKNRQRMRLALPLFPSYLFVHINSNEWTQVLKSPGVLRIVGKKEYSYLPNSEIEFLRSSYCRQRIEPYRDIVVGERVRIRNGLMKGLVGTLVRKCNNFRFVITVEMINQHAAIQVDAEDLEPITVSEDCPLQATDAL